MLITDKLNHDIVANQRYDRGFSSNAAQKHGWDLDLHEERPKQLLVRVSLDTEQLLVRIILYI